MPKSPKISPKVMYPCIFLAFYMSVRKLQGFITFHFLAFLEVFLKCYISLYFSYTHIEGKENTRICNFWWNVTYPCIFLALYMCVRKIQGYVTFHGKKVEKLHILVFSLHIMWPLPLDEWRPFSVRRNVVFQKQTRWKHLFEDYFSATFLPNLLSLCLNHVFWLMQSRKRE